MKMHDVINKWFESEYKNGIIPDFVFTPEFDQQEVDAVFYALYYVLHCPEFYQHMNREVYRAMSRAFEHFGRYVNIDVRDAEIVLLKDKDNKLAD